MIQQRHPVSERVIHAVADETGTDPLDLPPLYETIDPDALDALIDSLSDGELTFRYTGCAVTIESTGAIELDERYFGNNPADESATDE